MPGKPPFDVVVTRHGPTVLRVCRAVAGRTDADDAWSETFLAALRAYPDLAADANVEAWLVTIAHRKAIDVVRAAGRRAVPVADVPAAGQAAPGQAAPGQPALDVRSGGPGGDALDPDLVTAVAALPDKQRQTVAYHYLAGLPYADVARIVGGSAAAARRAAADGIATLRRTVPALDLEEHP